jgi:hypothetical protein
MAVEAVMRWNEPNNKSHGDFDIDVGWRIFADTMKLAGAEIRRERPTLSRGSTAR